MKILHLSGAMYWGGNEQQLVDLIHHSGAFGDAHIIFCFKGAPIEKYAIENGLHYTSVKKTGAFSLYLVKRLAAYVKDCHIGIIHIHTSNFVGTYVLADILYKMNLPTVFSKKGISDKSTFLSPIKYNHNGIDRIICVSEKVKEAFKKTLKKRHHHKLTVIYDGIRLNEASAGENPEGKPDLRSMLNLPGNCFLIGNIANHSQSKDLGVLLKTAHYLIHELNIKEVRFVQMGSTSKFTKEFIGLLDDYRLRDHVRFMGFVPNAYAFMDQFDVFLMTSRTEGIPLAIYEAFLNKVPVVSTVAGGIPEIISHNENGFLAETGDYKSLAHHIETLMNDAGLRTRFADNSYRKLTTKYNAANAAKHTRKLYETLIHEKS